MAEEENTTFRNPVIRGFNPDRTVCGAGYGDGADDVPPQHVDVRALSRLRHIRVDGPGRLTAHRPRPQSPEPDRDEDRRTRRRQLGQHPAVPAAGEVLTRSSRTSPSTLLKSTSTGRTLTPPRVIRASPHGVAECSHILRRGRYYYVFTAEGGTDAGHQEWVFRITEGPYGPWESQGKPLWSNGPDEEVQWTGHADIFEDGKGRWWSVFLDTILKQSYALVQRPGHLRLYGNCYNLWCPEAPAMLLRKSSYTKAFSAKLQFDPRKPGYEAVIVLWWNQNSFAAIGIRLVVADDNGEHPHKTVVFQEPTGEAGDFKSVSDVVECREVLSYGAAAPGAAETVALSVEAYPASYRLRVASAARSGASTSSVARSAALCLASIRSGSGSRSGPG
ncbi:hypothetical protein DL771_012089 [Monosporascus sp. 5C6A]|nr:hypothetical protein DL771_012089 [Monosporascus sp. 5C6A]